MGQLRKAIVQYTGYTITLVCILFAVITPFVEYFFYEEKTNKFFKIHDASVVFSTIMLVVATIGLVFVAWIQLNKLSHSTKGEGIIEFDKKWGSHEIIKARKIIHDIYLKAQENKTVDKYNYIGKELVGLSYNQDRSDDFMYILSFLNFFETVGFLCKQKYFSAEDLDELVGNSIKFYFQSFKLYIEHRRVKHKDNFFHSEFEFLYKEVKNNKKNSQK